MRYFLELAYCGAGFHGWQSQPNAVSVQQTLEGALTTILRSEIKITGAGRTDTGVNARQMYAHFDVETPIEDEKRFLSSLNKIVGREIAVRRVFAVADDAHTRFDAKSRTYKYFVIFEKSPFLEQSAWHCPGKLDIERMNEAAALLLEESDFSSFAKLHSGSATNICDVREARWDVYENTFGVPGIVFTITADRFLRNMVRAVVGTLVEVGRGKMSVEQFCAVMQKKDRCAAGISMPPQALFLWSVCY